MLHLIIPTRNEAPYIQDAIRRLSKSLADLSIPWQIIVADNGSTDNTRQTIEGLNRTSYDVHRTKELVEPVDSTKYEVRGTNLVYLECPKVGKGAAIRHTAEKTSEETLFSKEGHPAKCGVGRFPNSVFGFIDADLSADPDAIVGMVNRILEGEADIVIASRLLVTKTTNRSWLRTLSSKLFNVLADLFLNLKVADAQCGLKIMNDKGLEILKSCKEDGWFLDIEFLAKARQANLKIVEIPVPWIEFRYPNRISHINHLSDGVEALRAIYRIKTRIKNPTKNKDIV